MTKTPKIGQIKQIFAKIVKNLKKMRKKMSGKGCQCRYHPKNTFKLSEGYLKLRKRLISTKNLVFQGYFESA